MTGPPHVGLVGTASYLPDRWMTAAEIAAEAEIPEDVIVEKFGLRGKHIAADDEHVSDMAARAGRSVLEETGTAPDQVDAVVYYGSTWKDYPVWQAAPRITEMLGCREAFALELDYVSCGTPVALRVCRDLVVAEPEIRNVLVVAACKESHLIDYRNERARFTFNFADGAVAGLLRRDQAENVVLGSHMITDGRFALDVKVPAGGSVEPASHASVEAGRHTLDVRDPRGMKDLLDPITLPNFLTTAEEALRRSGLGFADVTYYCGIHMKRSMHDEIVDKIGVDPARAPYLDDTGHMSGVDPLLSVDRASRAGDLGDGDVVLLLAAGTGYTWAATVLRWGAAA
jgi:3-oxoacyl-[acyl-carrier-protein] synthase III